MLLLQFSMGQMLSGFMSVFGFIMSLANDSVPIMILYSVCLAMAVMINIRAGVIIFQHLFNRFVSKASDPQTSPINIASGGVENKIWPRSLDWRLYDDLPMAMVLKNNGRTVILRICCADHTMIPHVTGGELYDKYYFVETIFKWTMQQSTVEHSIDSHKFSLEMQALHRCNRKDVPFEYLTISYLFVLSSQKNSHLSLIAENLSAIRRPGSVIELPPFDLASLMPRSQKGFYSYGGTYDNGEQVVPTKWFINSRIFGISAQQLQQFAGLCSENGQTIMQNGRKEQPLGKRCVQYYL